MIQKYVSLPGDVLVTIKTNSQSAGATTYSLPNIHGDVMATVNADGALLDAFMTGPFGEVLPNQPTPPSGALVPMSNPTNTADGITWNYVGQHQKMTDLDTSPIGGGITQMGARVYIPTLGRFLSVDSIEGGTPNNYVYALDPVGQFDLDGRAAQAIPAIVGAIAYCVRFCPAAIKSLEAALKAARVAQITARTAQVAGIVRRSQIGFKIDHARRHLDKIKLSANTVENAIRNDLAGKTLNVGQSIERTIRVQGKNILHTGYIEFQKTMLT